MGGVCGDLHSWVRSAGICVAYILPLAHGMCYRHAPFDARRLPLIMFARRSFGKAGLHALEHSGSATVVSWPVVRSATTVVEE